MNTLKRLLGAVWIALALAALVLMFRMAITKTYAVPEGIARTNTALQWGIILFILLPISAGLVIFGYYSLKGEYDQLPEKSEDL
jgi:hypothetical protein